MMNRKDNTDGQSLIRPAEASDIPDVLALAIAAGLFLPHEIEPLREVLENLRAGHRVYVWGDTSGLTAGVVYFGPDEMTDRKWDLWMIAVAPDQKGRGIGGKLLRFTESRVRESGGRLLLIETSSLAKYEATRAFYEKYGYDEVARVPDYFADGETKVIFAKRILEN